jgi:hypothetical protein
MGYREGQAAAEAGWTSAKGRRASGDRSDLKPPDTRPTIQSGDDETMLKSSTR